VNKRWLQLGGIAWNANIVMVAASTFVNNFGQGVFGGARTNFFVETLGLDPGQILWLEGIREIPGLALIVLAALTMRLPLARRTAAAVALLGIGYALQATVHSYSALLTLAVLASLGMHLWMPLAESLTMSLATRETSGRMMGMLASVSALASIVGMGALWVVGLVAPNVSLRLYFVIGGVLITLSALLLLKLPKTVGATEVEQPRMLVSKRYWLFYVLTFFQGSRKQVLNTFGTLVLVDQFGFQVGQISLLLALSALVNLAAGPSMGYLLDRLGERRTLAASYSLLVLCCLGFAVLKTAWLLALLLIAIKLLSMLGMGLSTYVNRIAPPEELTPTLSAGISVNHISSVAMPILAGALWGVIGYTGIFVGTAALILLSIPFALMMQVPDMTLVAEPVE
jgi:MFS family permease